MAHDFLEIHPRAGGDLAGDHDHARLDQRLDGDACMRILFENTVQYGVGNLVGDLVRMALGHGF